MFGGVQPVWRYPGRVSIIGGKNEPDGNNPGRPFEPFAPGEHSKPGSLGAHRGQVEPWAVRFTHPSRTPPSSTTDGRKNRFGQSAPHGELSNSATVRSHFGSTHWVLGYGVAMLGRSEFSSSHLVEATNVSVSATCLGVAPGRRIEAY